MENGYSKQMKRLCKHTDVYFHREKLEDHHCMLDLTMKQLVLDAELEGLASEVHLSDERFNKRRS